MKIYDTYVDIPDHFSITASSLEEARELAHQYILANMGVTFTLGVPCQLGRFDCPYQGEPCASCHRRELDLPSGLVDKEIVNCIQENF